MPSIKEEVLPALGIINPVKQDPFDDPTGEWTFDFKYDGFRGVLHKDGERAWFRSKVGNEMNRFKEFAKGVAKVVKAERVIIDGEIVVLDEGGWPDFKAVRRKWETRTYVAFDLLWIDGEDLRARPLIERRKRLLKILPRRSSVVRLAMTTSKHGLELFKHLCELDLEGLVAKRLQDPYGKRTKWYKIKNPNYSQEIGRDKIFRRRS